MRTITETFEVYTFEELSKDAKQKAREWYENGNDMPFLHMDMQEKALELLEDNGIDVDETSLEVMYSLSYSQGDGAMMAFQGTWKGFNISATHHGHYSHYNSKILVIEKDDEEVDTKIYKEFNEVYVTLCKQLEKYGYDQIEYSHSEEAIKEYFKMNEIEFLANGQVYDSK